MDFVNRMDQKVVNYMIGIPMKNGGCPHLFKW